MPLLVDQVSYLFSIVYIDYRFGITIASSRTFNVSTELEMYTPIIWPVLVLVTGVVTAVSVLESEGNRSILYWVLLPCLVFGVAALIYQFRGV
jgi:hypothetical protein